MVGIQLNPNQLVSQLRTESLQKIREAEYLKKIGQPYDKNLLNSVNHMAWDKLQQV